MGACVDTADSSGQCPSPSDDLSNNEPASRMRSYPRTLPTLLLVLLLAACGGEAGEMEDVARASADTPVEALREADGTQVVEITVDVDGYTPAAIRLAPGVPARLVFTRRVEGGCAEQVHFPELDVDPVDLPLGEPVAVTFTPAEAGTFTFVCGMDMLHGTLVVSS